MNKQIVNLLKWIYKIANLVVELLGVMVLVILCVYSVVYIKGFPESNPHINLSPFLTSNLVYIWIGTLIVLVIGIPIWLITEIHKGIKKAKDSKLSAKGKARGLFWWLFKN